MKNRIIVFFIVALIACHKQWDAPPVWTGPDIHANMSIRELRQYHFPGNFEFMGDDWIIEGLVIADDRTGNFYKSLIVQDSTGGVVIRMDGNGLYSSYPVGTRVAVPLKNLWLGDYGGSLQIGAAVDRSDPQYPSLVGIPVPLFNRYLIKKSTGNTIHPIALRLDQLHDSFQNRLVTIDQLEFAPSDTGISYADAVNKITTNQVLKACNGGSIYLRTSGFADFAAVRTPRGNGTVTAVFTVFRSEKQLLIRDTSDIRMNGLRCTGAGTKILFSEDFESLISGDTLFSPGTRNLAETGNLLFRTSRYNGNQSAEISAFATGQPLVVSWLILPPVDLNNSANEVLRFQTKDGYDNGALLQVLVSTNYDGVGPPAKAKWTLLQTAISRGSIAGLAPVWLDSGPVSLASLTGKIRIAFRYEGADLPGFNARTTLFQIDHIRIEGN
jgi:hypothetical protein